MDYLQKYGYCPDEEKIAKALKLIAGNIENATNETVLKDCFSMMDLTSLHNDDTPSSIGKFVDKVNTLQSVYPDCPLPASICVFSNFTEQVCRLRCSSEVHTTAVAACFPTAQSFIEVKILECTMAVKAGADEVDVVIALNSFKDNDFEKTAEEIRAIRAAIDDAAAGRHVVLKVILETGLLVCPKAIAQASFLAMEAGADFIKTSTGKVNVNATPTAAYVMCECIAAYYKATGRKVGFKPAGGISSASDAVCYYSIVSAVLGKQWLDKSLMRLGVSRLGNQLLSAMRGETVSFF